ncbi:MULTISPECIES: stringent starvation protein B [unclassified Moraxella]|uniref:stringent starvation protein B n=1 Tax=unclassified Moraxella TaxID=2685852 RepID=UPI00359DD30E
MTFTPKRPHLVRALHEWMEDNDLTAYLLIDATHPDLVAPLEYAIDGRLVLAASYQATKDLCIDNDVVSFSARFGGVSQNLWIPMAAVIGIYAKENPNEGLFFDPNEYTNTTPTQSDTKPSKHNGLKFVD